MMKMMRMVMMRLKYACPNAACRAKSVRCSYCHEHSHQSLNWGSLAVALAAAAAVIAAVMLGT